MRSLIHSGSEEDNSNSGYPKTETSELNNGHARVSATYPGELTNEEQIWRNP